MIASLPEKLREQIAAEAHAAFPNECCGLIEGTCDGDSAQISAIHPTRNLAEAPDRFEIDPAEQIRLMRALRGTAREIIGCYHSHPNGRAEPSKRDLQNAADKNFLWLIAAIGSDKNMQLSAFVYAGGAFAPVHLARAGEATV
jgi:proteasome lid subunit RPN8/RPN11